MRPHCLVLLYFVVIQVYNKGMLESITGVQVLIVGTVGLIGALVVLIVVLTRKK